MTSITLKSPISKAGFTLPKKSKAETARARRILDGFYKHYLEAHCELKYSSPHELLVATILSAQATDVGVNKATPKLFNAFSGPADYASATPAEIEPYIHSLGFFRNKSKVIHLAMKAVLDDFAGEVPNTMDDLLKLFGVARKTANVVLGNAFGVNVGVVVDTHVIRLSGRFRLSAHTDPTKIELDLMALFPRPHWTMLGHMMIFHGRQVCRARGALCADHPLCQKYCSNACERGK